MPADPRGTSRRRCRRRARGGGRSRASRPPSPTRRGRRPPAPPRGWPPRSRAPGGFRPPRQARTGRPMPGNNSARPGSASASSECGPLRLRPNQGRPERVAQPREGEGRDHVRRREVEPCGHLRRGLAPFQPPPDHGHRHAGVLEHRHAVTNHHPIHQAAHRRRPEGAARPPVSPRHLIGGRRKWPRGRRTARGLGGGVVLRGWRLGGCGCGDQGRAGDTRRTIETPESGKIERRHAGSRNTLCIDSEKRAMP